MNRFFVCYAAASVVLHVWLWFMGHPPTLFGQLQLAILWACVGVYALRDEV
jgi:hypothetical protein